MTTSNPPGRYPHLTEATRELADLDEATRIRAIQAGIWINYTRAREILERMEDLLRHPPIDRMPNLLIVGVSNNGKTQILRRFLGRHPANPNPEGEAAIVPAVYVGAPPTPDIGDLCVRVLSAVNAPYKEVATPSQRIRSVKTVLSGIGTRLLLVDDIHNMLTGGAVKQREFRNALRDLGNELRISIVAAGIDDASTVFATDPQLSNRFDIEELALWKLDKSFGQLLASIESKLPLRLPSDLKSPELMQQIHFMSEGPIGEAYGVIENAAILAIKSRSERITVDTLKTIRWKRPSERRGRRESA